MFLWCYFISSENIYHLQYSFLALWTSNIDDVATMLRWGRKKKNRINRVDKENGNNVIKNRVRKIEKQKNTREGNREEEIKTAKEK